MVAAERGGFLHFKFRCFQNPGNKFLSGKICETAKLKVCLQYFTICISSQYIKEEIEPKMCDIHHQKTYAYGNEDLICNNPHSSKTYLGIKTRKKLLLPLYKTYFVKIEVRNAPWDNNQLIASFGTEFIQIPSANMSQCVYKDMRMCRTDLGYTNTRASLDISMGLKCDHDRYGEYCLNYCKPNLENIKSCTKDGQHVCQKGWKGEKCDTKDLCAFVSCIENGQCLEINGTAECWCNKQIGPHCHSNYNPCSSNPCKNKGICHRNTTDKMGYHCQCKHPFTGPKCISKIDICKSEPCKNNATCHHIKPRAFSCKCLQGFHGELCELNSDNANSYDTDFRRYALLICSLVVGIFIILLVNVFIARFIRKRNRRPPDYRPFENPPNQIDQKTQIDPLPDTNVKPVYSNAGNNPSSVHDQHSQSALPPSLISLLPSHNTRDNPD